MSPRFFRSLLLCFCMSLYVAAQTLNYDFAKHSNLLKRAPEQFTIPVSNVDYRNRARIAREQGHYTKIQNALRKSFGVTSKDIRRTPIKMRNNTSESLVALNPPSHLGQVISDSAMQWAWPPSTATTTTTEVTTTEATAFTTSSHFVNVTAEVWVPNKVTVSSQSVAINDFFTPRTMAFNNTIKLIKEFLKEKKRRLKEKRGKRKKVKSVVTYKEPSASPLKLAYSKEKPKLMFKLENSDMQIKDVDSDRKPILLPYAIGLKRKKKPEKVRTVGIATLGITDGTRSKSIEDLGARIEDQEAERLKADGENPMKYVVKDGILFKKNRTPVARIDLPSVDEITKMRKVVKKRPQTLVESSPFISEVMPPIERVAGMRMLSTKRPKPTPPLSPPTISLQQSLILSSPPEKDFESSIQPTLLSSTTLGKEHDAELVDLSQNDLIEQVQAPPPYPFSHCYMNIDGFMCCNRYLESLMRRSFRKLRRAHRFHECSVQKIANRIQTDCENVFNTTFEVVVGIDDFAIRAHFAGDLMCKIQEGGRFVASYATVMPSRDGIAQDPLHVITRIEMNLRDRDGQQLGDSIKFPENEIHNALHNVQLNGIRRKNRAQDIPFHEKSREDIDNDSINTRT